MIKTNPTWPGTYFVMLGGKPVGKAVQADGYGDAIFKVQVRDGLRYIPRSRFDAVRLPERQTADALPPPWR